MCRFVRGECEDGGVVPPKWLALLGSEWIPACAEGEGPGQSVGEDLQFAFHLNRSFLHTSTVPTYVPIGNPRTRQLPVAFSSSLRSSCIHSISTHPGCWVRRWLAYMKRVLRDVRHSRINITNGFPSTRP